MTTVREEPRQASLATTPGLAVLRGLFERLHAEGTRYCHWKSNEHLDASLLGTTDVDVLVERSAIVPLTRILGESGFKRFVVKPGLGYPGIEDYVGFDAGTGALTHLHVHYQLTLGEKFLKGHRLPWEELYLSTRVMDERRGLYVAAPHLELVVLVLRAAMKVRARDFLLEALGVPYFRGGMAREFRWLAARVHLRDMVELARRLVGARAAALMPAVLRAGGPSLRQLVAVRHAARPRLAEYRLYGRWAAIRHASGRELGLVWWKLRNWWLAAPTKSTRTMPQGGLLIAFLGADGAGKSTVAARIAEWLSHEVAVVSTYGGNGKGSAGWARGAMEWLGRVRRRALRTTARGNASRPAGLPSAPPPANKDVSPARAIWVLALARERRQRALDARRARGSGMVVVSDRYPQSQFPGWNDGPRLHSWLDDASRWRRTAARRERESFRLGELCPPDLVIKLHVPPELAARRKPETPGEQVRTGVELLRRLAFPAPTRVIDIDASRPLEQVLLLTKQAIWDAI
jgi:thymidylate kinase